MFQIVIELKIVLSLCFNANYVLRVQVIGLKYYKVALNETIIDHTKKENILMKIPSLIKLEL